MNGQPPLDGGGEGRTVEVRARTVDEAVARGLVRLGGLSRAEVRIEVLREGKAGLLGFGAEEAVVRLTVLRPGEEASAPPSEQSGREKADEAAPRRSRRGKESAPAPERAAKDRTEAGRAPERAAKVRTETASAPRASERASAAAEVPLAEADVAAILARAQELTRHLLELMGCETVSVEPTASLLPEGLDDDPSMVLTIRGKGTERLLTDDARPLLALQFLVRMIVSRQTDRWANLLLDVNGDRARRLKELFHLAGQSADLVEREGRPLSLPPMTPYERRVVHLALRDHPTVATQSIGVGDYRKVTIRLKGQMLPDV